MIRMIVLLIAILCLLTGLVMRYMTKKHRTEFGRSIKWYQVKYWFMPGIIVDCLTKDGQRLFAKSLSLIMVGTALFTVALFLDAGL